MKVYISGPTWSRPRGESEQAFSEAEIYLKAAGHEVINPMKIPGREGFTWSEYMLDDLRLLSECEAIFMLDGWQDSQGAFIEFYFALGAGKLKFGAMPWYPGLEEISIHKL